MKRLAVSMTAALMLFVGRGQAQADLVWDFQLYTLPGPTVGPTETVQVWGTLYNNSTNGESMSFGNNGADFFLGGWNSPAYIPPTATSGSQVYDFDNGVFSNPLHLSNMTESIDPGATYTFLISGWVPLPGGAPTGDYRDAHGIYFGNQSVGFNSYNQRSFSWQVTAVPEPATMLLLGIGFMGLAGVKRRMTN